MKKIISKLALIGVAVAALCTSCVVDDIQTTFDLAPAVCTVNVKVLYALDGSNVTSQASISSKYGNGATFNVPANSNKTVAAEAVAVTVNFKNLTPQTQTVNIATLLPGGAATYDLTFVFGSEGDITYEPVLISKEEKEDTKYLYNPHFAHALEADHWLFNDTEFILKGVIEYEEWHGAKLISVTPDSDPNVKMFADAIEKNDPFQKVPAKLDINVSAWAKYKAWQTLRTTTFTYDVIKKNTVLESSEKIGTYVYDKFEANTAQFTEEAIGTHGSHYVPGHGAHGNTTNAGGGIIFGE